MIDVIALGQYVELTSNNPEETLKQWLNTDESLKDICVLATDLEQAVVQLTKHKNEIDSSNASLSGEKI